MAIHIGLREFTATFSGAAMLPHERAEAGDAGRLPPGKDNGMSDRKTKRTSAGFGSTCA